ncbi:hypothetical protein ACFLZG_01890, partial [Thermodesulfobacteriota bacterium]
PRVPFSTMIRPKARDEIERLAKKIKISPSLMASNLIEMGLDDAKLLEKIGLLRVALIAEDVGNKIKKKAIRGEEVDIKDIQ